MTLSQFCGIMSYDLARILSIQSHVVSGYVGNKSATFPLQLLGFEVDGINSVQFSNHTGYSGGFNGQILDGVQLLDLIGGLKNNNLDFYTHIITGYIGSVLFLESIVVIINEFKLRNPNLIYVCDPVMGDTGVGMYVPSELLPIYKKTMLPLSDICIPNQYEAELLTDITINSLVDALNAIKFIHAVGVDIVILSSVEFKCEKDSNESVMFVIASCISTDEIVRIKLPKFPEDFVGTGDLFTALCTAWLFREKKNVTVAIEKTIATMQAVLLRTMNSIQNQTSKDIALCSTALKELKIIQSKADIEQPIIKLKAEKILATDTV